MNSSTELHFSIVPYLYKRWDTCGKKLRFNATNMQEYKQWRNKIFAKLKELTGYDTMKVAPLSPHLIEETKRDGYLRQKIEIQTEPNVWMPFYVLIPSNERPPFAAIIAPHGHCSGGKLAVAGITEIPSIADTIKQHNYDYGVQFVKEGFIVFCPDARGFGERQEKYARGNIMASSCSWINNMAIPLGQTIAGMWAWDIHRLIDYIQTRNDCIKDKIGCVGLSGGGLQTLWASALDTRIKAAVISGYFYGYKESLLDLCGNCSCNYVPHLYEYADMGDIGALIAPRPLLIETGTKDPLNGASGVKNVISQVNITRKAYKLLKAQKFLYHDIFEGEHKWHGIKAIPWMRKHLQGK